MCLQESSFQVSRDFDSQGVKVSNCQLSLEFFRLSWYLALTMKPEFIGRKDIQT